MAVGNYKLPICDVCKLPDGSALPWLPVGWTQDSDPRNPDKPLRCGKCKSTGWDREYVKQQKAGAAAPVEIRETLDIENWSPVEMPDKIPLMTAIAEEESVEIRTKVADLIRTRCKHRMTDCPICHPKEDE